MKTAAEFFKENYPDVFDDIHDAANEEESVIVPITQLMDEYHQHCLYGITKEEITGAADEYEKEACCIKDLPALKMIINEDFVAGAKWILSKLKGE